MNHTHAKDQRRGRRERDAARRRLRLRPTVTALEGRTLLSTIVVNNPTDAPVTGQIDLRQAIAQANADGGGDTIQFDSTVFSTPRTITLTSGQLELSGTTAPTTITGPGANLLSVSGNKASRVFQIDGGVTASISGLTITDGGNVYLGGGLYNGGAMTLTDCTVSGNSAGQWGGGLWNAFSGTATLTDCTLSGNSAGDGGGMFNANGGTATLINCTVSGNSASGNRDIGTSGQGGGLFDGSVLTLTNCTVSSNSASYGGGLFDFFTGPATLTNTIVAGNNSGGDIFGDISGSNNITGVADPGLAPLGDYGGPTQTMALLPGSPALDAGTTGPGIPAADQRGTARDAHPDIGAFEVAAATHFAVAGFPSSTTAGDTHNFTVTALDAYGNTAPDYTGTVQITSSDPHANLPNPYTFTSVSGGDIGRHTFAPTLVTAGTQSITATDGSITSTESGITVNSAAASHFEVSGFSSPVIAGTPGTVTVTAKDQFGNVASSGPNAFNGTVTLSSSDGQANLPSPAALSHGSGSFNITLKTAGVQSITAASGGLTGSQSGITVNPAAATQLVVSGFSSPVIAGTPGAVAVTAKDPFGNVDSTGPNAFNGTVTITSSDNQATLPSSAALSHGSGSFAVTLKTAGTQSITATSGGLTGSQSNITVSPAAPASVAVVSGSPQSTTVAQGFANPLVVVVKDTYGNLVPGASVAFAAPASGASATLVPSSATTGNNGQASVQATANTLAGSYTVLASVAGVATPASFTLTQTLPATGVSVIGSTIYIVGVSTKSDSASVMPAGTSNTGSTGVTVTSTINGVSSTTTFTPQPQTTFTTIVLAGYAGNETFTLAPTLTLAATVTAGDGNDTVQLGAGPSLVILGNGNDKVSGGNGNDIVTLGTALGKGNNTVTLGDGNDTVTLSGGNNTVTLGNGADKLTAGDGNNTVTLGNGNDTIQLGNGSNVVVEGNGTDTMTVGNGNNFLVGGLGSHTMTAGNGTNILIDGSATVTKSGDSFRQILNAWTANPVASNQAAIRSRFTVTYNSTYPNHLTAGSGIDWFFYKPPTTSNKKSTDFLN